MLRSVVLALVAFALLVGVSTAADKNNPPVGKAVKAQMVKGTIKLVDPSKALLIVNQKLTKDGKSSVVDRELSILETTEFDINGQKYVGKEALQELVGKEGASVKVQCDKDVNVLKVTVQGKKK